MDTSKPLSRLAFIRSLLIPEKSSVNRALDAYLADYRNKKALGRLLTEISWSHPAQDMIALADILVLCKRGKRCNLSVCPSCSRKSRPKERQKLWQDLIGHVGDIPNINHLSYVTINDSPLDTLEEAEILDRATRFSKSLCDTRRNWLPSTQWVGHLDIGEEQHGGLHAHLIIHHEGIPRDALRSQLEAVYKGNRAVHVAEWFGIERLRKVTREAVEAGELSLVEANLRNVTGYICKSLPKVTKRLATVSTKQPKATPEYGINTARLLAERLLKLVHLRQRGFQGTRIRFGIKRPEGIRWYGSRMTITDSKGIMVRDTQFRILGIVTGETKRKPAKGSTIDWTSRVIRSAMKQSSKMCQGGAERDVAHRKILDTIATNSSLSGDLASDQLSRWANVPFFNSDVNHFPDEGQLSQDSMSIPSKLE